MKAIRIGNDIRIRWPLSLPSENMTAEGVGFEVTVKPSRPSWCPGHGGSYAVVGHGGGRGWPGSEPPPPSPPVRLDDWTWDAENGVLSVLWPAGEQFACGVYDIELTYRKDDVGQAVADQCRFVRLVEHSAQADLPADTDVEAVVGLSPLRLEMVGLSAYEIAVMYGYSGSLDDFGQIYADPDGFVLDYKQNFVDTGLNKGMPGSVLLDAPQALAGPGFVRMRFVAADKSATNGYVERGVPVDVELPLATQELAGVMSAGDKASLDKSIKSIGVNVYADYVEVSSDNNDGETLDAQIPAATPAEAGVMSAEDKARLEQLVSRGVGSLDARRGVSSVTLSTRSLSGAEGGAEIPSATATAAGVMSAADKLKLDSVKANATFDSALSASEVDAACV